jgi:adenylate cyclase
LTDDEEDQLARVPTTNLEAYDYYLRAETEGYYNNDYSTFGRAMEFYSKAIEHDPKFADALAGYARVAAEIWRFDFDQIMPGALARKRAYDAAGQALELDPSNARAYTVLAILQLGDGRHEEAIQSARRAVGFNPNDAEAHANLGMVLAFSGQPKKAVPSIEQGLRLNPVAPPGFRLLAGIVFYIARDYDRAAKELEPVVALWPGAENPRLHLAATYAARGQLDMARHEIAALPDIAITSLAYQRLLYDESYKRIEDLNRYLEELRAAGMPEWPFGFEGKAEDRVTGDALLALVVGHSWTGYIPLPREKKAPFMLQIDEQARVAYGSTNTFLAGEAKVENDQLCMHFDGYMRNRWLCGHVYRNRSTSAPDSDSESGDYVYVLADGLRYFSVER